MLLLFLQVCFLIYLFDLIKIPGNIDDNPLCAAIKGRFIIILFKKNIFLKKIKKCNRVGNNQNKELELIIKGHLY